MSFFIRSCMLFLFIMNLSLFASVGKVSLLKGEAFVQRDVVKSALKNDATLEEKDIITTSKDGQIQLIFEDKTVVTLGSESELRIMEYLNDAQQSKAKFKFNQGSFKTITGQIGKMAPDSFKIETKTAAIGIRGTWIKGQIEPDGDTIGCLRGSIFVQALNGGKTVEVFEGYKTFVGIDQSPTNPSILNDGDFGNNDNLKKQNSNNRSLAGNDYSSWGYWNEKDYQEIATIIDDAVFGGPTPNDPNDPNDPNALTPISTIAALTATNTSYTYNGTLAGTGSADSGITSSAISNTNNYIQLNVSFGLSEVTGTMSLQTTSGAVNYSAPPINIINGTLGAGNSFTANLLQGGGAYASGSLQGNFHGANAETTSGTFSVGENTSLATGTFNAAR